MAALALGLLAALGWGLHDLCVRRVSRRAHIPSCLLAVLGVGTVALLPLALWRGVGLGEVGAALDDAAFPGAAFATGAAFALASYALYRAFAAGPVRLVAPLTASYPVLTMLLAALDGAAVGAVRWLAVVAVIGGVALVAARDGTREAPFDRRAAIGWSLAAAAAFAVTFDLGQGLAERVEPALALLAARLAALLALAGVLTVATSLGLTRLRLGAAELPVLALMGTLDAAALGLVLVAGRLPEAALASVTASLFGLVTIVLARLFLAEPMSARQWSGVGLAFAAIATLAAG